MSNVTIQKRGKFYQYKFEIAKIDGKRKFLSKSGFKTKSEAEKVAFGNLVRKHFKIDTKVCFAFRVDEIVLVTFPDQKADGVFERIEEEEFYLE